MLCHEFRTMKMMIDKKPIGENAPCFIIAEAGSNHNRDFPLACELIDAAARASADAVKFQLFRGEKHYSRKTPLLPGETIHPVDLLKGLEMPYEWIPKLKEHARKKEILFFSSVTDYEDVDALEKNNIGAYKLASFELVDLPLITYTAGKKKPIILSTGLANMEEIDDAYQACKKAHNDKIVFLQCASVYPSSPEIMNLRAMHTIQTAFPDTIIGLSDHTIGVHISVAAVAMGAKVIEKHFTLSRSMKGPDHSFSMEPQELSELVRQIRDVEKALGDGKKVLPSQEEMVNYYRARRSIHTKVALPKGTILSPKMFTIKRPGYGIKPKFLDSLTGRAVKRDIEADEWMTWEMV